MHIHIHTLVTMTKSAEFGIFRKTTCWSGLSPTDASSVAAITRPKDRSDNVTDEFRSATERGQQVLSAASVWKPF